MPVNKDVLSRMRPARPSSEGMISENDLKILWVSRTLTNIDFRYGEDLLSLERSPIEIEQKSYIRKQLMLKHQERREPYQKLLDSLLVVMASSGR
jgi:hypothetical protein